MTASVQREPSTTSARVNASRSQSPRRTPARPKAAMSDPAPSRCDRRRARSLRAPPDLRLLKRLDQSVEQNPVEAAIVEPNAVLVVLKKEFMEDPAEVASAG